MNFNMKIIIFSLVNLGKFVVDRKCYFEQILVIDAFLVVGVFVVASMAIGDVGKNGCWILRSTWQWEIVDVGFRSFLG